MDGSSWRQTQATVLDYRTIIADWRFSIITIMIRIFPKMFWVAIRLRQLLKWRRWFQDEGNPQWTRTMSHLLQWSTVVITLKMKLNDPSLSWGRDVCHPVVSSQLRAAIWPCQDCCLLILYTFSTTGHCYCEKGLQLFTLIHSFLEHQQLSIYWFNVAGGLRDTLSFGTLNHGLVKPYFMSTARFT